MIVVHVRKIKSHLDIRHNKGIFFFKFDRNFRQISHANFNMLSQQC